MKKTYLVLAVCGDDEYIHDQSHNKAVAIERAKELHARDTHNGERYTTYIVRIDDDSYLEIYRTKGGK